jgi:hypothetical protein
MAIGLIACLGVLACADGRSGPDASRDMEVEDAADLAHETTGDPGPDPTEDAVPDTGPGDPPPDEDAPEDIVEEPDCPPGAACFEIPGVFHAPTPDHQVERRQFEPPAGTYSAIHLEMDVYHGGWAEAAEAIRHNVFWLAHNARNFDLYGYVNFEKPRTLHLVHGVGMVHGDKPKLRTRADLAPIETYHVDYDYDTGAASIDLLVTRGGTDIGHITDTPNITEIVFGTGDRITLDFGFEEGLNPAEPPTYGWEYSSLILHILP